MQPVTQSRFDDLDPDLLQLWRAQVRQRDPLGLGRFDDEEILVRAGACTREGVPTVAGILALGLYPQQFFPSADIRAAVVPAAGAARASHDATITGPIPAMMRQAMQWAQQAFPAVVLEDSQGGDVQTTTRYPLLAFREIISNALIHRDYSAWSYGRSIQIRVLPDRLIAYNPGGLYGITSDQLGKFPVTSARNPNLLKLCSYLPLDDRGNIVEALAQGIPTINRELALAHLPPAQFDDTGIGFTVMVKDSASDPQLLWNILEDLPPRQREVVNLLRRGVSTIPLLQQELAVSEPSVRRLLTALVDKEIVSVHKKPQQRAQMYRLEQSFADVLEPRIPPVA